jgi:hypothetical protein
VVIGSAHPQPLNLPTRLPSIVGANRQGEQDLKKAEDVVEILEAFDLTGSFRAAAELAGCSLSRAPRRLPGVRECVP